MNALAKSVPGIVEWATLSSTAQAALLERPQPVPDDRLAQEVANILARVRTEGDTGIRAVTAQVDGIDLAQLELTPDEITGAIDSMHKADLAAIQQAIANVRQFHQAQQATDVTVETSPGISCTRLSHPIESVGLYVPAGTAPLPSTAIMLGVPALIAGCPERIVCTPPQADGSAHPAVVAAAASAGVARIFRVGGAQAIAAMAYGTDSIPRVAKIFGPGNGWVTMAKTLVASERGGPAIDMPAGPSELLIIADGSANPSFVAADLLSQAEHGVDSQTVLISTRHQEAAAVRECLEEQMATLSRQDILRESVANCLLLVVPDLETAVAVSNRYAPEHLIVNVQEPRALLADIRNAGSVFLGPWAPESVGDYCSGTNHVLPTGAAARSYSALGLDSFMRYMTVQELSADGLERVASTVRRLAWMEGLDAHANAVSQRFGLGEEPTA